MKQIKRNTTEPSDKNLIILIIRYELTTKIYYFTIKIILNKTIVYIIIVKLILIVLLIKTTITKPIDIINRSVICFVK